MQCVEVGKPLEPDWEGGTRLHHESESVHRVYAAYDRLATETGCPRIALLHDLSVGKRAEAVRKHVSTSERTGLSDEQLSDDLYVEGHAAIGAVALASAFLGGVGEPDTTLVARGGPDSRWLLQKALAGWETGFGLGSHRRARMSTDRDEQTRVIYSARTLRCRTAVFEDSIDRVVRVLTDSVDRSGRGVSRMPEKLSVADVERRVGRLADILTNVTALGLLDPFDTTLIRLASSFSCVKPPVVLIDTESRPRRSETKGICDRAQQLASMFSGAVVSVSAADLPYLAEAVQLDSSGIGSARSPAAATDGELQLAQELAGWLRADVLLHSSRYAALLEAAGINAVVSTFSIDPKGGTNGAGDTFNAGYLAAAAARHCMGSCRTGLKLSVQDCLTFACALSGVRLHRRAYATRPEVCRFALQTHVRVLPRHTPSLGPGTPADGGTRKCQVALNPGGDGVRRIVLVDLDHTLFPSKEGREWAGTTALGHLDPTKVLTREERLQLFRFVYSHDKQLSRALKVPCSFRLEWNRREFYLCAAVLSAFHMTEVCRSEDRVGQLPEQFLVSLGVRYHSRGDAWDEQAEECVRAFNAAGYVTFPGVRGALEALSAVPDVEVYCLVEGRVRCQWKKLRTLGLADVIPRSRLLVDERMIVVDPESADEYFGLGDLLAQARDATLRRALSTVRRKYSSLVDTTQTTFRMRYLAAIGVDHSAPGYVADIDGQTAKHGKLRLRPDSIVNLPRPVRVAIVGDRPDPELTWFDEAVGAELLVGCGGMEPGRALWRVNTGAYSDDPRQAEVQRSLGITDAEHLVAVTEQLKVGGVWEDLNPISAVRVPRPKLTLTAAQKRACQLVSEDPRLHGTAAAACALEVLGTCQG